MAIARRDMVNLLHPASGGKVDFWMLTDEAFDRARFARRLPLQFGGVSFAASRPEDTILQKLKWAQASSGSEKQLLDALRVYERQQAGLDHAYLDTWGARLGVEEYLRELRGRAMPL